MESIDRGITEPSATTADVTFRDSSENAEIVVEEQPRKPAIITFLPLTIQFPNYALKYGALVKEIGWNFDTRYGIVDYTRVFIESHENRGVAVTRDTVESFWVEAVKTHFKDSQRQRFLHLRQVRAKGIRSERTPTRLNTLGETDSEQIKSALINDCWIHRVFDLNSFASLLVRGTVDTPESDGLRVWRSKRLIGKQPQTVMFLHDTHGMFDCNRTLGVQLLLESGTTDLRLLVDCKASISKAYFDITRAVLMPYLGLSSLRGLYYRSLAPQVRRGDGQPMDQALMRLVWRGIVCNLFYFESEELKKTKLEEEDWQLVQMSADVISSSPKPIRDGNDQPVPKRKREEVEDLLH